MIDDAGMDWIHEYEAEAREHLDQIIPLVAFTIFHGGCGKIVFSLETS